MLELHHVCVIDSRQSQHAVVLTYIFGVTQPFSTKACGIDFFVVAFRSIRGYPAEGYPGFNGTTVVQVMEREQYMFGFSAPSEQFSIFIPRRGLPLRPVPSLHPCIYKRI